MGYLVTAGGERRRVNLQPRYKIVGSIVERIRSWSADSPAQPPAVILNKHCPYCPFKSTCTRLAEAADDLSLLDRMTPKSTQRHHDKGTTANGERTEYRRAPQKQTFPPFLSFFLE